MPVSCHGVSMHRQEVKGLSNGSSYAMSQTLRLYTWCHVFILVSVCLGLMQGGSRSCSNGRVRQGSSASFHTTFIQCSHDSLSSFLNWLVCRHLFCLVDIKDTQLEIMSWLLALCYSITAFQLLETIWMVSFWRNEIAVDLIRKWNNLSRDHSFVFPENVFFVKRYLDSPNCFAK